MSPYKSFIAAAKTYLESIPFLNFLLSASIYIFAGGGLLFLLGLYIPSTFICDMFVSLGSLLLWAGLLLSIVKGDVLTIVITSGAVALGSLIDWFVNILGGYSYSLLAYALGFGGHFAFTSFLYFSIFGAIAIVVLIRAEKFMAQRAAARPKGLPCPRCGNTVPFGAAFCPTCAAPATQYAPPQPPPYAPPQYAPPQPPPQYAPPQPSQYAPPQPSQYAPQYAPPQPPPAPVPEPPVAPEPTAALEPSVAPHKNCANCGAELPADAMFCGKCGTHQ